MLVYRFSRGRFIVADESALTERLGRITCLCGGGGKTSLLFFLGKLLARKGEPVLLTTTTQLGWEEDAAFSADEALRQKSAGVSPVLAAAVLEKNKKLGAFSAADQQRLFQAFERSLVEADGSRGLPLKLPRPGEPILPKTGKDSALCPPAAPGHGMHSEAETDTALFLLLGLSALGRPAGETVHRLAECGPALYPELSPDTTITVAQIAAILDKGYLQKPAFQTLPLTLILNQADTPERLEAAEALALELMRRCGLQETRIFASSFARSERHPR